jgi:hypothetical protein
MRLIAWRTLCETQTLLCKPRLARVATEESISACTRSHWLSFCRACSAAAPPAPVRPEKKKESKKTKKSGNTGGSGSGIDVQYTNTGAMDIVFASDSDTGKCWIKDVQSSRLKPGMRLVSMDVLDTETQKMVTRELDGVPFTEVVKELEAQTSIGQQGISAYHMKFEPDLESAAVTGLSLSRLVRMESKHDKEVIDALEAIDRGTERYGVPHVSTRAQLRMCASHLLRIIGAGALGWRFTSLRNTRSRKPNSLWLKPTRKSFKSECKIWRGNGRPQSSSTKISSAG